MAIAFGTLGSERKIENITTLDDWSILTDAQLRSVMEQASMSAAEKQRLKNLIARVGAFKAAEAEPGPFDNDDIPF